jgi:hypothetical protein
VGTEEAEVLEALGRRRLLAQSLDGDVHR